jgi:hypothetical protein
VLKLLIGETSFFVAVMFVPECGLIEVYFEEAAAEAESAEAAHENAQRRDNFLVTCIEP